MRRREFPKAERRKMLARSGGRCEATGPLFGLPEGVRCDGDLAYGLRFEHLQPDRAGGAPTAENGAAVCPRCWRWKTDNHDQRVAAKGRRVEEKRTGVRQTSRPLPGSRRSGIRRRMNGEVERW